MTQCADEFEERSLQQVMMDVERRYICWALNKAGGNKKQAARIAGVQYPTFMRKLAGLELKVTYHVE